MIRLIFVQINQLNLMKKILLFAAVVISATQFSNAQSCTPDPQYTSQGFYPDSTTGIAVACVGVAYDQVITMVSPTDTVIQTVTVQIDSVVITGVSGLPASISYACGSANCTIYPQTNTNYCIDLYGTATAGEVGDHTFAIEYTAYGTIPGFGAQSLPLTENYKLTVDNCTAGLLELTSQGRKLVKIVDMTGREVNPTPNTPLIYIYDDGTTEKVVLVEE